MALPARLADSKPMRLTLSRQLVGKHVRRLREEAGLSLRALAAASGFSASLLSQLENGLVSPSIHSMEKISNALGVTLGAFFSNVDRGAGGGVIRVMDRDRMTSSWSKARIEALSPMTSRRRFDSLLITLGPGGRSGKRPVVHPTEEFAFVVKGRPTLHLGSDEHRLGRGDAVTLPPTQLRLWTNTSTVECCVLVVALRGHS